MSSGRPFVLVICDGWGYNPDPYGNAIAAAATPELDALMQRWPHTLVEASGEAVGLPAGQQGNSEVGHLTMGSGRILYQPLTRISRAIASGEFFSNHALCAAVDRARDSGAALHCLGLVSPGGVHSDQAHAVALAQLALRRGLDRVWFHAFTDGRDEPPTSAAEYMARFCADLERVGVGRVASVSGRYYAMDRDRRWDRVQRAYEVVAGIGNGIAESPLSYIESQYAAGITDEFIEPASIAVAGRRVRIDDGDSVIFFNFRPDRMRQLVHALIDTDFTTFTRSRVVRNLHVVTFTEYEAGLPVQVAYPAEDLSHTLAEEVSAAGLRQFHVAETEKYAHVTYFINGGREQPFAGEERLLVPSPKVATYDLAPAMSAEPVTDAVLDHLTRGDDALVVVNYANADMVGHTGDFDATVQAVQVVDRMLGSVGRATLAAGGAMLMTADHGNAEYKIDQRDGSVLTAHTTSLVPVLLCGTEATSLRDGGGLRDVAPTVLSVMGLPVPATMTGTSLLESPGSG
ncbi:MAG TPA: 2,3-bisphosphoglycerate-independent phosphoglycerate mutase [Candidatus Dormibacteraeota bacterium]|nr:2,3-bisphosphoglycerate-independent phosphoglycerate mutase [Candidatus Dormibacteraeota bacterium]